MDSCRRAGSERPAGRADAVGAQRKPKGKLVALLVGAGAVVLVVVVVVTATFWKDVYCHLFLDPRLVGRWKSDSSPVVLQFDRIGNVARVEGGLPRTSTYRIDGTTMIIGWPEKGEPNERAYEVVGDTLSIDGIRSALHRVPDDS